MIARSVQSEAQFGKAAGRAGDRPARTVNLIRLSQQLDTDMLAAALLLREEIIKSFVAGREPVRPEYATQITIHLTDAGFPPGWLDMPNAPLEPEWVATLRELAAMSTQKAPVRRDNLKKLLKAFESRLDVLADALEIVTSSLTAIANGALVFDDQRMGHVNPRLMSAGFPNGWLEHANAEVKQEWLDALVSQATDHYERSFEQEAAREREIEAARLEQAQLPLVPITVIPEGVHGHSKKTKQQETKVTNTTTEPKAAAKLPASVTRGVKSAGRALPGKSAKPAATEPTVPPKKASTPTTTAAPPDRLSKEQSKARAGALEELFARSRRGIRGRLWQVLLEKSGSYWTNVKSGAILMSDERAGEIADLLGLPGATWFDNPSFPPATLAPWVMDDSLPMPNNRAEAQQMKTAPQVSAAKAAKPKAKAPTAAPAAPAQAALLPGVSAVRGRALRTLGRALPGKAASQPSASTTTTASASPPPAPPVAKPAPTPAAPKAAPKPTAKPVTPVPRVGAPAAAPAATPITAPAASVAPAPVAAAPAAPGMTQGYVFTPPTNPQPVATVGRLTQILLDQLNKMALAGEFTDRDAMDLMYQMMGRK